MRRTVTIIEGERRITLFRVPRGLRVTRQQLGCGLTILGDGDIIVMPSQLDDTEAKRHFARRRAPGDVKIPAATKLLLDLAAGNTQVGDPQIRKKNPQRRAPRIVKTRDIKVEDLQFRDRLRPLRAENVAKLAESLKTLGQTRAITVRADPEQDGKFRGIAGNTVFEAAKSLSWTHVRADIMECTEVEARLWEASENLYRAELTAMEEAEHQAECVRLIAEREAVSRQNVAKPNKSGRPEGAIAKAAKELAIKGKTQQARRKAIERGIKIAAISPEAKVAAREAGLDDDRSALREIAKVNTSEGQLKKIQEMVERKAKKQAKRTHAKAVKFHADDAPSQRAERHPDDVVFAELKSLCSREFKRTWVAARTSVCRRFLREELSWDGGKPLSNED